MMRNDKGNSLAVLIMFVMSSLLVLVWGANAQAQTPRAAVNAVAVVIQQPPFTEYKGVRLGMTAQEVRAKLGTPAFTDKELGYFVFSETEAVQIGYDAAGKVKAISVDYQNGTGAPEPRAVVGAELETRENGSLYRVVYYDKQGFSVSYSRTAGPVIIVTITITKV
jgi:outer membrane protein assembly factor BamE (lipoprotein component of BamABCDE complex)